MERGVVWRRASGVEPGLRGACAERCVKMEVAGVGGCAAMVSERPPQVALEERLPLSPS